eukprot:scaffold92666_cov18-Tisochrysis_lutea.AAC.1
MTTAAAATVVAAAAATTETTQARTLSHWRHVQQACCSCWNTVQFESRQDKLYFSKDAKNDPRAGANSLPEFTHNPPKALSGTALALSSL